jgi:small subunit ribosomal protein S7
MPRRARIQRRVITPDPVYTHGGVAKFINCVMLRGKKSTAERIVYDAFDIIKDRSRGGDPLEIFDNALREIRPDRRAALARRWIIRYARARGGRSMAEKLANELMDANNNLGAAVKRKEDTHKMAESNKAFSHFRY